MKGFSFCLRYVLPVRLNADARQSVYLRGVQAE